MPITYNAWSALVTFHHSFHTAVGHHIVGTHLGSFSDAVVELQTGIARTRDYIYESAVALERIAKNYYDTEARNQEVMQKLAVELEGLDDPVYRGPAVPSGGHSGP